MKENLDNGTTNYYNAFLTTGREYYYDIKIIVIINNKDVSDDGGGYESRDAEFPVLHALGRFWALVHKLVHTLAHTPHVLAHIMAHLHREYWIQA